MVGGIYVSLSVVGSVSQPLSCHVDSPLQMCSIVLPGMKARKRGAIVNIGSGSATFLPSYPLYAVYGATKARP